MPANEVPLYDVTVALAELRKFRQRGGVYVEASTQLADELAYHMARHFPDPLDRETAGRAVVIVVASLAALQRVDSLAAVLNIGALAGERLMTGLGSREPADPPMPPCTGEPHPHPGVCAGNPPEVIP